MSKRDYFPAFSRWRKRNNYSPPVVQTPAPPPESRPLVEPVDDPTEHPLPRSRILPSEWEAGKHYWPNRMYVAGNDHLNDQGEVRIELRAVDTHIEVTYAYCQKGHLHVYHNGKLVVSSQSYRLSKHYSATAFIVADASKLLGWKDKAPVFSPACEDGFYDDVALLEEAKRADLAYRAAGRAIEAAFRQAKNA